MRWMVDGTEYDSRFEYEVLTALSKQGNVNVRRTSEHDSIPYTRVVRQGVCSKCGSDCVVSTHSYTADAYVSAIADAKGGDNAGGSGQPASAVEAPGYYAEVKGYLRADRRSLLRALRKARPDVDLRFIVQRDYRVTKSLYLTEWIRKYLKCPVVVYKPGVPISWP
jgi:hypothetical protein